jgi:hypothetical protein
MLTRPTSAFALALLAPLLAAPALAVPALAVPAHAAAPEGPVVSGRWTWQAYGSASIGDQAGEVYRAHVGAARGFHHGLSFGIEAVVGGFNGNDIHGKEGSSGVVGGFDVLWRWHFRAGERWTAFADVGAGALWFEDEYPAYNGTSFNFDPQAGMGLTRRIGERAHLIFGARWHHVSNGDLYGKEDNRGVDAALPYLGVVWRP